MRKLVKVIDLQGDNHAKVYYNSDYKEYVVEYWKGKLHNEGSDYYTEDRDDAFKTAKAMVEFADNFEPKRRSTSTTQGKKPMISLSAQERSQAQMAYTDLMKRKLEQYGVKIAFKLPKEQRDKFFAELKAEWAAIKQNGFAQPAGQAAPAQVAAQPAAAQPVAQPAPAQTPAAQPAPAQVAAQPAAAQPVAQPAPATPLQGNGVAKPYAEPLI